MKLGAYIFPTGYSIGIVELAKALEERGFESLWVTEHTHIPASRESAWPGGGELPREYSNTLDPFIGLAAAAAATSKLRLGTGICLVPEHDPIVLAKVIASLDLISNGRFEFGIGAGWNAEELANHGTAFKDRFKVMEDRTKAMRAIWTQEEASYEGPFTKIDRIWSNPKPIQTPHPPILLGGESKHTLRRVMEFCDGWFPRGRGFSDPQAEMDRLYAAADEYGRAHDSVSASLFGAKPDKAFLDKCAAAGVKRGIFTIPSEGRETVLPLLDKLAQHL